MRLPLKHSRKARDSDSESEFDYDDDAGSEEIDMEQEDNENDEIESEDDDKNDDDDNDDDEDEDAGVDDDDDDDEDDEQDDGEESEDEEEEEEDENNNRRKALRDDAELDELEKQYTNLRHQERDILSNLKRHKDEDILKGQALKNQKALWDRALEFRFLLQKAFSSSNRLPQDPIRSCFCDSDQNVNAAYSDLITSAKKTLDSLSELQEALLEKNPSIQASDGKPGQPSKHLKSSKSSDEKSDEDWSRISEMHGRIAAFRDKSIDKWQRKSQVTTGAAAIKSKLHAFNQNISEQVASYMRDPSRMIKQMQLRRSTVSIFGTVPIVEANPKGEEEKSDGVTQADGDPELIDDSEFYQQLLKEFFESIDPTSNETAIYALKRRQTKKRKLVDRRASKGRKIRYHVHEKLLNFMTRQPPPNVHVPSALGSFNNLFQSKTLKADSAE